MSKAKVRKSRYKKNSEQHILTYYLSIYSDSGLILSKKTAGRLHLNKQKFVKQVDKKEHYLRKVGGYAIGEVVLEELYEEDVQKIVIKEYLDKKWNRTLISYTEDWKEKGIEWEKEPYERQIVLKEEDMMINA